VQDREHPPELPPPEPAPVRVVREVELVVPVDELVRERREEGRDDGGDEDGGNQDRGSLNEAPPGYKDTAQRQNGTK
jgi:hypothetical protein